MAKKRKTSRRAAGDWIISECGRYADSARFGRVFCHSGRILELVPFIFLACKAPRIWRLQRGRLLRVDAERLAKEWRKAYQRA